MAQDYETVDPYELQMHVIENRPKYIYAIALLMSKCNKRSVNVLEAAHVPLDDSNFVKKIQVPDFYLQAKGKFPDIEKRKKELNIDELKDKMKEQIEVLKVLDKMKNSPIATEINKL